MEASKRRTEQSNKSELVDNKSQNLRFVCSASTAEVPTHTTLNAARGIAAHKCTVIKKIKMQLNGCERYVMITSTTGIVGKNE
jgi:hypothetical protein